MRFCTVCKSPWLQLAVTVLFSFTFDLLKVYLSLSLSQSHPSKISDSRECFGMFLAHPSEHSLNVTHGLQLLMRMLPSCIFQSFMICFTVLKEFVLISCVCSQPPGWSLVASFTPLTWVDKASIPEFMSTHHQTTRFILKE